MKKLIFIALLLLPAMAFSSESIAGRLQGKILLAVEDRGKTYFVQDGQRYQITKQTAQKVFEKLALGITNENLSQIPLGTVEIETEQTCPTCEVCATKEVYVNIPGLCDYREHLDEINRLKEENKKLTAELESPILKENEIRNRYSLQIIPLRDRVTDLRYRLATPGFYKQEYGSYDGWVRGINKEITDITYQIAKLGNQRDLELSNL